MFYMMRNGTFVCFVYRYLKCTVCAAYLLQYVPHQCVARSLAVSWRFVLWPLVVGPETVVLSHMFNEALILKQIVASFSILRPVAPCPMLPPPFCTANQSGVMPMFHCGALRTKLWQEPTEEKHKRSLFWDQDIICLILGKSNILVWPFVLVMNRQPWHWRTGHHTHGSTIWM